MITIYDQDQKSKKLQTALNQRIQQQTKAKTTPAQSNSKSNNALGVQTSTLKNKTFNSLNSRQKGTVNSTVNKVGTNTAKIKTIGKTTNNNYKSTKVNNAVNNGNIAKLRQQASNHINTSLTKNTNQNASNNIVTSKRFFKATNNDVNKSTTNANKASNTNKTNNSAKVNTSSNVNNNLKTLSTINGVQNRTKNELKSNINNLLNSDVNELRPNRDSDRVLVRNIANNNTTKIKATDRVNELETSKASKGNESVRRLAKQETQQDSDYVNASDEEKILLNQINSLPETSTKRAELERQYEALIASKSTTETNKKAQEKAENQKEINNVGDYLSALLDNLKTGAKSEVKNQGVGIKGLYQATLGNLGQALKNNTSNVDKAYNQYLYNNAQLDSANSNLTNTGDYQRLQGNGVGSKVANMGLDIAKQAGQQGVRQAENLLTSGSSQGASLLSLLSGIGSGRNQAINEGGTLNNANLYGLASGATDSAVERLSGGIPGLGSGSLDDVASKGIQKLFKSTRGRNIANLIYGALGEGTEEYISNQLQNLETGIYNKDNRFDLTTKEGREKAIEMWEEENPNALYGALTAGLYSGLAQGIAGGVKNIAKGSNGKDTTITDSQADIIVDYANTVEQAMNSTDETIRNNAIKRMSELEKSMNFLSDDTYKTLVTDNDVHTQGMFDSSLNAIQQAENNTSQSQNNINNINNINNNTVNNADIVGDVDSLLSNNGNNNVDNALNAQNTTLNSNTDTKSINVDNLSQNQNNAENTLKTSKYQNIKNRLYNGNIYSDAEIENAMKLINAVDGKGNVNESLLTLDPNWQSNLDNALQTNRKAYNNYDKFNAVQSSVANLFKTINTDNQEQYTTDFIKAIGGDEYNNTFNNYSDDLKNAYIEAISNKLEVIKIMHEKGESSNLDRFGDVEDLGNILKRVYKNVDEFKIDNAMNDINRVLDNNSLSYLNQQTESYVLPNGNTIETMNQRGDVSQAATTASVAMGDNTDYRNAVTEGKFNKKTISNKQSWDYGTNFITSNGVEQATAKLMSVNTNDLSNVGTYTQVESVAFQLGNYYAKNGDIDSAVNVLSKYVEVSSESGRALQFAKFLKYACPEAKRIDLINKFNANVLSQDIDTREGNRLKTQLNKSAFKFKDVINEVYNTDVNKLNSDERMELYTQINEDMQNSNSEISKKTNGDSALSKKLAKFTRDYNNYDNEAKLQLPQELIDKIQNAKTDKEVSEGINQAEQIIYEKTHKATVKEKADAWRKTGMLFNPKTWVRNTIGNAVNSVFNNVVNTNKAILEKVLKNKLDSKAYLNEDTQAIDNYLTQSTMLGKKDQVYKDMANAIYEAQDVQTASKYYTDIASNPFESNIMRSIYGTVANLNNKIMNGDTVFGDEFWYKHEFVNSLAKYLKANNADLETIDNYFVKGQQLNNTQFDDSGKITDTSINIGQSAIDYAKLQAQIATYKQDNGLYTAIQSMKNSDDSMARGAYQILDAIFPFRKTPLNIMSESFTNTPIGIIKGMYDIHTNISNGTVTTQQAVDTLSRGLAGTEVMALGAVMKHLGLLTGSGDEYDDEELQYLKDVQGWQAYALHWYDSDTDTHHYYDLGWLAPTSVALCLGSTYEKIAQVWNGEDDIISAVSDTIASLAQPISDMTTLSSLDYLDTSGDDTGEVIGNLAVSIGTNYAKSFVPSLYRNVANTFFNGQYKGTVSGVMTPTERFVAEMKNLINPTETAKKVDYKGDLVNISQFGNGNVLDRIVSNFISPGTYSKSNETETSKAIFDIYENLSDEDKEIYSYILPYTYNVRSLKDENGNSVNLKGEELQAYNQYFKSNRENLQTELINSDFWDNLSYHDKAYYLDSLDDYISEQAQYDYLSQQGINAKVSNFTNKMNRASDMGLTLGEAVTTVKNASTKNDAFAYMQANNYNTNTISNYISEVLEDDLSDNDIVSLEAMNTSFYQDYWNSYYNEYVDEMSNNKNFLSKYYNSDGTTNTDYAKTQEVKLSNTLRKMLTSVYAEQNNITLSDKTGAKAITWTESLGLELYDFVEFNSQSSNYEKAVWLYQQGYNTNQVEYIFNALNMNLSKSNIADLKASGYYN